MSSQLNTVSWITNRRKTYFRDPLNSKKTLMAIELTKLREKWKTKQPDTFRASILVDGFNHLFSILLASFVHHIFMLCRRG